MMRTDAITGERGESRDEDSLIQLSIVIPAYNCAQWLARAVLSAYTVGPGPIEVIVVDDGSTDETSDVVACLLADYPALVAVKRPNGGLSAARNTGIQRSSGKYIIFLDADDELIACDLSSVLGSEPDVLRIGFEEITVGGEVKYYGETLGVCSGESYFQLCATRKEFFTASCAFIYRRQYLQSRGLQFIDGLLHEDMLFSVQAVLGAEKFASDPIPLYRYFRREHSITTTVSAVNVHRRIRSLARITPALTILASEYPKVDVDWWILYVLDYASRLAIQSPWRHTRAWVLWMTLHFWLSSKSLSRDRAILELKWRLGRSLRQLVRVHR